MKKFFSIPCISSETYLLNRPIKRHSSTEASRRNTVSAYLGWLHQHIMAFIIKHELPSELDPLRGVKFARMESEVTCLTQGELYLIQTAVLPRNTKRERSIENARNIYLTSYFLHGLRAGDVVGARVSQLQSVWQMENGKPVQSYRFYSLTQKRNKAKSVLIEDVILPMLLRYVEGKAPDDFLFPTMPTRCKHLTDGELMEAIRHRIMRVNESLKMLAQQLGINKRLTMHSARHTFAEMLYEETGDLRLVSDALTHARFDTTQKYLRRGSQTNSDRANRIYSKSQPAPADELPTETLLKQNPEMGETILFGDSLKTGS
jgi:integrase